MGRECSIPYSYTFLRRQILLFLWFSHNLWNFVHMKLFHMYSSTCTHLRLNAHRFHFELTQVWIPPTVSWRWQGDRCAEWGYAHYMPPVAGLLPLPQYPLGHSHCQGITQCDGMTYPRECPGTQRDYILEICLPMLVRSQLSVEGYFPEPAACQVFTVFCCVHIVWITLELSLYSPLCTPPVLGDCYWTKVLWANPLCLCHLHHWNHHCWHWKKVSFSAGSQYAVVYVALAALLAVVSVICWTSKTCIMP